LANFEYILTDEFRNELLMKLPLPVNLVPHYFATLQHIIQIKVLEDCSVTVSVYQGC